MIPLIDKIKASIDTNSPPTPDLIAANPAIRALLSIAVPNPSPAVTRKSKDLANPPRLELADSIEVPKFCATVLAKSSLPRT